MKLGRTVHFPARPAAWMRQFAFGWKTQHQAESRRGHGQARAATSGTIVPQVGAGPAIWPARWLRIAVDQAGQGDTFDDLADVALHAAGQADCALPVLWPR